MNTLQVIKNLAEYYGKDMNEAVIKMYLDNLDDIPSDLLELASTRIIRDGPAFMPRVAELRRAAEEVKREGKYQEEWVDPLKLMPGACQTEDEFDRRYGSDEYWGRVCEVLASDRELPEGWTLTETGMEGIPADLDRYLRDGLVREGEADRDRAAQAA